MHGKREACYIEYAVKCFLSRKRDKKFIQEIRDGYESAFLRNYTPDYGHRDDYISFWIKLVEAARQMEDKSHLALLYECNTCVPNFAFGRLRLILPDSEHVSIKNIITVINQCCDEYGADSFKNCYMEDLGKLRSLLGTYKSNQYVYLQKFYKNIEYYLAAEVSKKLDI